jgi:HEAT repeat protein
MNMGLQRTGRRILVLTSAGLLVVIGQGCAGGKSAKTDRNGSGGTFAAPAAAVAKYQEPVAASQLRERAITMLTEMTSDPTPQIRGNAIEALSVTPARLEPHVPAGLRDPNAGVRSTTAMMVGKAQITRAVSAVRPLLTDASPYVRASAIYALRRCGQDVDPSELAALVLQDPSPRVRAHAAYLLGELGDPSALGLLHDAARQSMPRAPAVEVRILQIQLAEAMVKLGEEDQLGTIRAALYPSRLEDLEVMALAVQSLGQLRDRGSIDELILISARKDPLGNKYPAEVRLGVAGALARMGLDQGTFIADEFAGNPQIPALRAQAAYTYGEIGRPENLAKLEVLMDDPEGIVRVSSAAAVLRMTAAGKGLQASR